MLQNLESIPTLCHTSLTPYPFSLTCDVILSMAPNWLTSQKCKIAEYSQRSSVAPLTPARPARGVASRVVPTLARLVAVIPERGRRARTLARVPAPPRRTRTLARERLARAAIHTPTLVLTVTTPLTVGASWNSIVYSRI